MLLVVSSSHNCSKKIQIRYEQRRLVYQRFSPQEQHGCATGGATNVIASLLAGAEIGSDSQDSSALSDHQRECQLGAQQESVIERWAKVVGGDIRIKTPELRQGGKRQISNTVVVI